MNEYQKECVELSNNNFIILSEKKVPKHKLTEPKKIEDVENEDSLGILIKEPYVVIDVDNALDFERVRTVMINESVKCHIMKTTRGGHFWFKSSQPISNNIGINTPLSINVDVRSYGKLCYVKVKDYGEWREWLQISDELDELPVYLKPIKHDEHFLGDKAGDGRNSKLYSYIITLTRYGLDRSEIRETIELINEYILGEPLNQSELETILRDESFDDLRPAFFNKNIFLHNVFGNYIMTHNKIYSENGRLYVYHEGVYSQDQRLIESIMIDYIPNLVTHQRREVLNYLLLKAPKLKRANPYYVSCENGTVDIKTKQIHENTPKDYIRNKINANYNPDMYDETTDNVLNKICCNDYHMRLLLEEMIGYILLPTTKFHKSFILYGDGSNGKSTLLDMITFLIGEENHSSLSLKELNHNFKLSEITNKLVNIGDDINDDYIKDSSIFKKLVTGDEITVDKKNEQPFKIRSYATLLFATNNLPQSKDKSGGMDRRLIILPFDAMFKSDDPDFDPFILDKLTSDNAMSYLLNLGIQGARRLFNQNGFTKVPRVQKMLQEYQKDNNNVLVWLEDNNPKDMISQDVYDDYVHYCYQNNVTPFKLRKFNSEVVKLTPYELKITSRGGKSKQVWTEKELKES